jgi:hypothetical protein
MHTNRIKWLEGASPLKQVCLAQEGPQTPCKRSEVSKSVIRALVGLTTSRSDPPRVVILHKGCVLFDPYLTQGTCRITPASNICGTYVEQLNNHDITDMQANSHKSGLPYGQGKKARNLESTASHRGKGTSKISIYE